MIDPQFDHSAPERAMIAQVAKPDARQPNPDLRRGIAVSKSIQPGDDGSMPPGVLIYENLSCLRRHAGSS